MTAKQSIAFVCHPYHRGGVTRWMTDAAITAAAEGHTVYFVVPEPASPFFSAGGRETMITLLQPHSQQLRIGSRKVNYTFEFGTEQYRAGIYRDLISRTIPGGTPLILSDDDAVWLGACALAHKYPVIGVLHGDQDYYYDKARKYHNRLSACICVSGRIKRNLISKCPGIDQRKVTAIPCGIPLPDFHPSTNNTDTLRLAFIGRLTDYEKRAADLVTICADLQQQGIAFHLHIAGNSDSSAITFGDSFKAAGAGDKVTFHGWQSKQQVQQMLNHTDVLLLTSNSEGMPLVMMEALASGCGFTGTRVSGIEDFEHDPRAADCLSVYTVGDIADATDKIRTIAAVQPVLRRQSARKLAETEFSMQVCLARYFKTFSDIKPIPIMDSMFRNTAKELFYSKSIATARYLKMLLTGKKQ